MPQHSLFVHFLRQRNFKDETTRRVICDCGFEHLFKLRQTKYAPTSKNCLSVCVNASAAQWRLKQWESPCAALYVQATARCSTRPLFGKKYRTVCSGNMLLHPAKAAKPHIVKWTVSTFFWPQLSAEQRTGKCRGILTKATFNFFICCCKKSDLAQSQAVLKISTSTATFLAHPTISSPVYHVCSQVVGSNLTPPAPQARSSCLNIFLLPWPQQHPLPPANT